MVLHPFLIGFTSLFSFFLMFPRFKVAPLKTHRKGGAGFKKIDSNPKKSKNYFL